MKVDHAHMPGMDHTVKKPENGKPAVAPSKAGQATRDDAPASSDKVKSQRKSGKS